MEGAAAARVAPEQVEARIGRRAIIDTRRPDHWDILRHATLYTEDDGRGELLRFDGARQVLYWARDIPARNGPVVGIIWWEDGRVEAFTAYVLPP